MAVVPIVSEIMTAGGYNLTDSADFTVLVAGALEGVEFPYEQPAVIVLKNTTGGAAVFTLYTSPASQLTLLGLTTPDLTVTVAAGKTWVLPSSNTFSIDGTITVTCDVAGSVLILRN